MFIEKSASKSSLSRRKLIYDVGINDADYITSQKINGKIVRCPYYRKWCNMMKRCYSIGFHKKQPTYKGCSVCDQWLIFSNFKDWMESQNWEGMHLDKDIINTGNKVYSSETCLFVTQEINKLLEDSAAIRGLLSLGVDYFASRDKFRASCSVNGKFKFLGYFDLEEDASEAYKHFKSNLIMSVALQQDEPLKSYLIRISSEINSK